MTDAVINELSMKTLKFFDRPTQKDMEAQVYWGGPMFNIGSEEVYDKNRVIYQNLALISAVLSSNIYEYKEKYLHRTLENLGVIVDNDKDIKIFSDALIERGPLPLFAFAHTKLKIGNKDQLLVFIIVRGADNNPEVLANVAGSFTLGSWHPRGHLAHTAAKILIMRKLKKYLASIDGVSAQDTKFLITGHSYGGAASNLVAKQLENTFAKSNIYCFTFGSPNNIIVSQLGEGPGSLKFIEKTDNNIHNIRNSLDPICLISDVIPLVSETYTMYGRQHWFSSDPKWFEYLPVAQLAATRRHHERTNYINFVLSTMDAAHKQTLPVRYNELYALGQAAVPLGIIKLKKKISERKIKAKNED